MNTPMKFKLDRFNSLRLLPSRNDRAVFLGEGSREGRTPERTPRTESASSRPCCLPPLSTAGLSHPQTDNAAGRGAAGEEGVIPLHSI